MNGPVPPRAVVFDLDGTIVDSLPLVLAAIRHGIGPFGAEPTMDIFARLGGPPAQFMATLVDDPRHVPEAMRRMFVYHRDNAHLIRPFAGARELLQQLRAVGRQSALWTGRDRRSTDGLLQANGLGEFFATVVCGDDLPSHKPDPAGLREIMRRLELESSETLLVGDADVDVLGADACGVAAVLIRHEREIAPAILAKCRQVVSTPAEAFAEVRRCVGRPA